MSDCTLPPPGWWCSRDALHEGPCAARPLCDSEHHGMFDLFEPACPCKDCPGHLKVDGRGRSCRNIADTLTFLRCPVCQCAYGCKDYPEEES